jgi:hypothetical protein
MLRRDGPPVPSETLLTEHSVVRKLWSLKQRDGCEVSAVLFYLSAISEATIEVTIRGSHGEDVRAGEIAESLRKLLVHDGATELEAAE